MSGALHFGFVVRMAVRVDILRDNLQVVAIILPGDKNFSLAVKENVVVTDVHI